MTTWAIPQLDIHLGNTVNHVISNTVTDPLNNDTVHTFTALDGGCMLL